VLELGVVVEFGVVVASGVVVAGGGVVVEGDGEAVDGEGVEVLGELILPGVVESVVPLGLVPLVEPAESVLLVPGVVPWDPMLPGCCASVPVCGWLPGCVPAPDPACAPVVDPVCAPVPAAAPVPAPPAVCANANVPSESVAIKRIFRIVLGFSL